jgi:hypothetical protein
MERAQEIFDRIVSRGETAIDEFIHDRQSEELFLDFKRSSDEGKGNSLSNEDRKNLSKAISGFGNSEGGVIVWGVDCSKGKDGADVAKAKLPITDAKRFQSWLEGAISGCTVPPHSGVRNATVLIGKSQAGFVVTYIPKSDHAPHQMIGKLQYYIRAGSDFVPTPHQVLAGMFGKRPQPRVYPMYLTSSPVIEGKAICAQLGFIVRNGGPGIATDLFLNVMIWSQGGNSEIALQPADQTRWAGSIAFENRHMSLVTNPGIRLPPEAQMQPVVLHIRLIPPFTKELCVEFLMGAGSSIPHRGKFTTKAEDLEKVYSYFCNQNLSAQEKKHFIAKVFSIPNPADTDADKA